MDCIFCKIVNKEIPAYIIHEDDDFLVILDLAQSTKGHTLIISKKHAEDIFSLDRDTAAKALPLAAEIAKKLKNALGFAGLNIIQNNSPIAGQTIFHFHIHLIPRYEDDGIKLNLPTRDMSPEEMEKLRDMIKIK